MDNNIFGKQLNFLRKKAGFSQQELVNAINNKYKTKINRTTISKWENGTQEASMNFAKIFADFFNVSLDYINGLESADNQQKEKPVSPSDDDIKFALFGKTEIDDETYESVKNFAKFAAEQKRKKREGR